MKCMIILRHDVKEERGELGFSLPRYGNIPCYMSWHDGTLCRDMINVMT